MRRSCEELEEPKLVHKSNRLIQKLTCALRWNQSYRFTARARPEIGELKQDPSLAASRSLGRAQSWAKLDGRVVRVIVKISYRLGVDSEWSHTSSCC
jgi:hypothetical protein